ncbi:MAG: tRNA 2-selenouridine(34) synthase MnmH [Burkholderiales bacterium]|nr:tRNA 2-selenouridine(34) synthase MnmH [Burkholderiales bacterium]
MSLRTVDAQAVLAGGFDALIDARSPAEFAEDHLPGALNWPVLDDDQRRLVGTLYKEAGALPARKVGAPIVARNIACHLERELGDKPREWQPLVYCWRGGQRSGTLAWFLGEVGFRVARLDGGYKAWRAMVRTQLETLPAAYRYRVLCGRTGSAKTRLLQALAAQGAQVLDLEGLARHRGSVLGALPGTPQPSQKHFEHRVWQALRGFDPARPVWIESESRKIGALRVPEALIAELRERGMCLQLVLPDAARLDLLLDDYAHFLGDPQAFNRQLDALVALRGRTIVSDWQALARAGRWRELFGRLMREHYDPLYDRSLRGHWRALEQAPRLHLSDAGPAALAAAARELLAAGIAPGSDAASRLGPEPAPAAATIVADDNTRSD